MRLMLYASKHLVGPTQIKTTAQNTINKTSMCTITWTNTLAIN